MRWVDDVDDRAQPKTEIPPCGQQRGERFRVAAPGSGEQIINRQRGDIGGDRPLAQVAPKIARERRQVRDVHFPATRGTTAAARAVQVQGDVAEFASDAVLAPNELAAEHDADAQTIRHGEIDEVAGRARITGRPQLRERARFAGILDLDGQADSRRDRISQQEIAPT